MQTFVIYARTSTRGQNLGLEAQQAQAERYVQSVNGSVLGIYKEQESGKRNDRAQLVQAIDACKRSGATLLVAKLDRLSRNVSFLFQLREELERAGVGVIAADMPGVINSTLSLAVMAGLAQQEREMISARTKSALAVVKASGKRIGREKGCDTSTARAVSAAVRKSQADDFAAKHFTLIRTLRGKGCSYREIANVLNAQGLRTSWGKSWYASSVRNVLERVSVA